jgi:hypothetical protein
MTMPPSPEQLVQQWARQGIPAPSGLPQPLQQAYSTVPTQQVAVDLETGKSYDVTNPAKPVDITPTPMYIPPITYQPQVAPPPAPVPTQQVAVDLETGKSYDVAIPSKPVEVEFKAVEPPKVIPVTSTLPIATDVETGKLYDVTVPSKPQQVVYETPPIPKAYEAPYNRLGAITVPEPIAKGIIDIGKVTGEVTTLLFPQAPKIKPEDARLLGVQILPPVAQLIADIGASMPQYEPIHATPEDFIKSSIEYAQFTVPFVGTATNWDNLTTTQKIASSVMDLAFMGMLFSGIRSAPKTTKVAPRATLMEVKMPSPPDVKASIKIADNAGKAWNTLEKETTKLNNIEFGTVEHSIAADKAQKAIQSSVVADNKLINQLQQLNNVTPSELTSLEKTSGIKGLKQAILDVSEASNNLDNTWRQVADANYKYGIDSVEHTQVLNDVVKAQAKLDKAINNYGEKASVRYTFNEPQFVYDGTEWKLKPFTVGEAPRPLEPPKPQYKIVKEMAFDPETGKTITRQKVVKVAPEKQTALKQISMLEQEEKPIYREVTKTKQESKKIPKVVSERVTKVKVSPKIEPIIKTGAKVSPFAIPRTPARVVPSIESVSNETYYTRQAREAGTETTVNAIGKPLPSVVSVNLPSKVSEPNLYHNSLVALHDATREAIRVFNDNKTGGMADTALKQLISEKVDTKTKTITDTKVRTIVDTNIKTIINKLIETRTIKTPKVPKKIILSLPDGKPSIELTEAQHKGIVAWKQGIMYILKYPPYATKQTIYTRTPVDSVPYLTGSRSAYESIISKGGKLPKRIEMDMGFQDVVIKTTSPLAKPTLSFHRDIGNKTKAHKPIYSSRISKPKSGWLY